MLTLTYHAIIISMIKKEPYSSGFTVVELLIVIVVIAILAAVSIVAFGGYTKRAAESALKSDLQKAGRQIGLKQADSGVYPASVTDEDVKISGGSYMYDSTGSSYCLTGRSVNRGVMAHSITEGGTVRQGACPGHGSDMNDGSIANGSYMQTVTSANCPETRTRAVDARDNRTYWIQKLSNGKCWMLTNLAYGGGGATGYGDTKPISAGVANSAGSFTSPFYYVPSGTTNFTVSPTDPSTVTNGNGQYGYLYNWCAAMGGQTGTASCSNATTPSYSKATSICPAGWRVPTSGASGDFGSMWAIIGGTTGVYPNWLFQLSGWWSAGGFGNIGSWGHYWSSDMNSAGLAYKFRMNQSGSTSSTAYTDNKEDAFALRCVTN